MRLRDEIAAAIVAVSWKPGYGDVEFKDVLPAINARDAADRVLTLLRTRGEETYAPGGGRFWLLDLDEEEEQ
jgi:hypothetical protein